MGVSFYPADEVTERIGKREALWALVRLSRPFTLIAPALGMLSGGLVAWFATGADRLVRAHELATVLFLGTLAAALLNAASNAFNQIFDLDIDRINKPDRPLCTGVLSSTTAGVFAMLTAFIALILAFMVSNITGSYSTVVLFALAALATGMYSAPPARMKARGWAANVTVAIPRGTLLKVAGWSLVADIWSAEAWLIGGVMGLFLLGATTTKDFADMHGDGAYGVKTLPVLHGPEKAARMTAPFLFLPFLLIPIGTLTGTLTGNAIDLYILGGIATLWGFKVVADIMAEPAALTRTENHPAWHHMYWMMVFLQIGFVLAYIPHGFYATLYHNLMK
ncbi:UbiA family prenyltransferase [Planctomycetota bacterium]|nr:UbiA family prenyltransferase [Planctomycetota bacterium]